MPVSVRSAPFEPYAEVAAHQHAVFGGRGQFGATAVFVGTMRDFSEGDAVQGMTLEHYPGMTERHLDDICATASGRWPLLETLVIHRVGEIFPGEAIVLVVVWSAHRQAAFDACREIMEALKSRAPFWKKERLATGTRWVTGNTAGYPASKP